MPESEFVTVRVSSELLSQLVATWSEPVQIKIEATPGIGTGWELTAREPEFKAAVHVIHCDQETSENCPARTAYLASLSVKS